MCFLYQLPSFYITKYSKRLKSRRPDFGVFENRPVPKQSRFQTVSEIRTLSSGFRTFGSILKYIYNATGRPDFGRLLYFYR